MSRRELEAVKMGYNVGDDRYAPHLVIEHFVAEVEASWRENARLRKRLEEACRG